MGSQPKAPWPRPVAANPATGGLNLERKNTMEIEIKPAPRSNPEGRDDLPWNIWKDGVNTNVKPNKAEAEQAAHNLLHKASPSVVKNADIPDKHYMDVIRPRGCPQKGSKVEFQLGDRTVVGKVTDYLSTQFIVEWEELVVKTAVVRIDDDWSVK